MGERDANAVQVNVRARPFSAREAAENAEHCVTFFCKTNQIKLGDKLFAFDNVFPPESSQDEVFEDSAAPLLEKFLAGYNCTMLAYGQTGAGKTFTMGTEETKESLRKDTRGIIPRIADKLFERIGESSHSCSWEVSVSMLEVYQEDIVDLLNANKDPLNIREHKGIVFVQGLSSNKVMSLEETMAELEKGCLARSKGSTAMNATSSRSHAIFTINLSKSALSDEECGFTAKFHLVDLAGSERLKKTQAEGERKKEGIKINEGLLALGNVISALSDGLKHIPYRDSKITRILQDSLGGNSCTVMVACISPADTNAEETLSTLRYADRAKKIKNKAVVNVDPQETMLKELKEEILRLRQENAALCTGSGTSVSTDVASGAFSAVAEAGEAANDVRKKCEEVENKLLETAAQKILLTSQLFKAEEAYERLLRNVRTAVESEAASDAKVESLAKLVHAQMLVPVGAGVDDTLSGDERMEIDEVDEHDQTFPERFVKLQEELEKEMERVNQQIKLKEKQFLDNTRNEEQFEKLRETHMKDVAQLQERISAIQAERDQLAEQLKRAGNSNKIAEDRRKRLQELEKELSSNKKRLQEMRKLEQYKAHAQETAKLMRSEIDVLKQARVRMMKQLKQESDKYRVWKSKHERQIQIMKSKERKLELEAARTKQSLGLQLEVFRRKYQESVACNKRLQQQLLHTPSVRSAGGGEKIDELKKIVEDELTLVRTTYEAHVNTNAMLEQRKALSKKLSTAKARRNRLCSEPPTKRRLTGDESKGEVDDEAALKTVEDEIGELEKEINLCSEQIRALQTDTSSVDLDARCDTFCAQMTSQWGKQACRILLEAAMAECRQTAEKTKALEEHEAELRDLRRQIDEERKQEDIRWDALRSEMLQTKQEASSILVTSSTEVAGLLQMALSNCAMSHQQYSSIEQWIDELTSTKDHIERMEHESEQQDQKRRTLRRTGVRLPRSTSATQIGQKTLLRDEREARSKKVDRFGDGLDPDSSAVLRATGLNLKRNKSKRLLARMCHKRITSTKKPQTNQSWIPSPILRSPPRTLEFDEKENAPVDQRNTTFVRDDADATFLLDKSLLGVQKPSGVANLGPMSSQK